MLKKINFSVPITEALQNAETGDFMIRGMAINATTTRNKTKFLAQELDASANTLRDKPILKDHQNLVDNIVGRTTQNVQYDSTKGGVVFEGRIVDKAIQEKISQGLIQNVSIGAHLTQDPEIERNEAGEITAYIAKGIDFVELSLVAVPADPNAGFAKAFYEALTLNEEPIAASSVKKEETIEEAKAMAEENNKLAELRQAREQLETELEIARETAKLEQLQKEKVAMTEKKVVIEDKTQGEVTTSVAGQPKYSVERFGNKVNITAEPQAFANYATLQWSPHERLI